MHWSARSLLALAVIVGCLLLWQEFRPTPPRSDSAARQIATPVKSPPASSEPIKPASEAQNIAVRLNVIFEQLTASHDANSNRQSLAELRQFLDSLDPTVASRELQTFLGGGKDASTKLDITIKPGGRLGDASSLRVFLLDYLGQIDRPAAGALATQILSSYTNPDEWAVSLRNYAWANPGAAADAYLQTKARELLANPLWRKKPSAGFLEAFDTIVYAHGTALTPELASLIRDKDNRAAAHAAHLTLDRLTIAEPVAMLKQFVEQPELMTGREKTRANYFARANVRQPEQRALVEQYLLDPSRTPVELATFAGIYPSANYMISNNLLSTVETPTGAQLASHDREALRAVAQWQDDTRFERLQPLLKQIRERLETFVHQTTGGDR